jgi:hypothetical protein
MPAEGSDTKKILFSVLKGRFPSWKAAFLMKSAVADFISGNLTKKRDCRALRARNDMIE